MTDGLIIQEMKNRPGQNNRVIHDNRKDNKKMKELYEAIEAKIKASGYPRAISGEDVYNDICDQIDGKENGSYVLLSKFEDDVIFCYLSLKKMWSLSIISRFRMKISTWGF